MKFENVCFGVFAIITTISIENVESEVSGNFALTFEGFLPLVDKNYRLQTLENNEIFEKISLSMYRYYMVQHLYARLLLFREPDADEEHFKYLVDSLSPILPQGLFKYLDTIRNIKLREPINGKYSLEYSFLVWPNSEGHFGRVNSSNHWKYMSFPAPAVVAQAIQEDYFYSMSPSAVVQTYWDLKPHLAPDNNMNANLDQCKSPGLPTQNLLGWKPFTELTSQQRRTLQSCGITNNIFDTVNQKFHVNICLLGYIDTILRQFSGYVGSRKVTPAEFSQRDGRVDLVDLLEPLDNNFHTSFSRTAIYTDQRFLLLRISDKGVYSNSSVVTAFRVKKGDRFPTWSIYDWSKYQCVPQDWIDTRNTVTDFVLVNVTFVQQTYEVPHNMEVSRREYLEATMPSW